MADKLLIVGMGYVGKACAKHFQSLGWDVFGTYRSNEAYQYCKDNQVTPVEAPVKNEDLEGITHILVCAAPGKGGDYEATYLHLAQHLCNRVRKETHVLYISSTSIYGDYQGQVVTEKSELKTESPNGLILVETEKVYQTLSKVTILRLGQIIGPGREMLSFIEKFRNYSFGDGSAPVNLSPLEDIVSGIAFAFSNKLYGTYNLCLDEHPTRKELYDRLLKENGKEPFSWDAKPQAKSSKIVCSKLICSLGFNFQRS